MISNQFWFISVRVLRVKSRLTFVKKLLFLKQKNISKTLEIKTLTNPNPY